MKSQYFLGFCFLLLAAACTRHYYFKPAATQPGQTEAVYTRGVPGLRSQQFGADITAGLSARGEKDMSLQLYIYNDSDESYTVQPEGVRVTGYDAFGVPQPLRVFEANEYVKWKRNRDMLTGAIVIVATVALILVISELSDDGTPSGPTSRPDWTYNYFYNPLDWIDFSVNTAIIIGSATAPPPQREPTIPEDGFLRQHTVYPGEAVQGIVKVRGKTAFMQKILVEVPVNGAYHKFVFENRQAAR
ncbi:MAG: hypothetical protein ACKVU2_04480 [Saprospiraceae bacterium]